MDPVVNSSTLCVLGVGQKMGALSEGAARLRARFARSARRGAGPSGAERRSRSAAARVYARGQNVRRNKVKG
jgi:hypothetical protein